jgi:hypothetical protein
MLGTGHGAGVQQADDKVTERKAQDSGADAAQTTLPKAPAGTFQAKAAGEDAAGGRDAP